MEINLSTVLSLAGHQGRNTLQIPSIDVEFVNQRPIAVPVQPDDTNGVYPDDFFMTFNLDKNRPVIGREQGYLYLTRKGYNYFRDQIAAARRNSDRHQDIESLDAHVEQFFNSITASIAKQQQKVRQQLDELNALMHNQIVDLS